MPSTGTINKTNMVAVQFAEKAKSFFELLDYFERIKRSRTTGKLDVDVLTSENYAFDSKQLATAIDQLGELNSGGQFDEIRVFSF